MHRPAPHRASAPAPPPHTANQLLLLNVSQCAPLFSTLPETPLHPLPSVSPPMASSISSPSFLTAWLLDESVGPELRVSLLRTDCQDQDPQC